MKKNASRVKKLRAVNPSQENEDDYEYEEEEKERCEEADKVRKS